MAGKTGADAVFRALERACRTVKAYQNKLHAIIVLAQAAGVITAAQATKAHDFVDASVELCGIFGLIAEYNSITP